MNEIKDKTQNKDKDKDKDKEISSNESKSNKKEEDNKDNKTSTNDLSKKWNNVISEDDMKLAKQRFDDKQKRNELLADYQNSVNVQYATINTMRSSLDLAEKVMLFTTKLQKNKHFYNKDDEQKLTSLYKFCMAQTFSFFMEGTKGDKPSESEKDIKENNKENDKTK